MTEPQPAAFTVILTDEARADLLAVSDQRTVQAIGNRIDSLETDPVQLGKPLLDDLKGYYSTRAAGQRYRVIHQVAVESDTRAVVVVVIGIRQEGNKKDVYKIASRRLG